MNSCVFKAPAPNQRRKPKEFATLGNSSSSWQVVQWLRRNLSFYQNIQSFWRMEEQMMCLSTSSTTTTTMRTWLLNVGNFLVFFFLIDLKLHCMGTKWKGSQVKLITFMGMKGTKTFNLKLFNENRSYVKTNINTAKKL